MRRGAWYHVKKLGPREAIVDVVGERVDVPRACLEIMSEPPRRWSVVPRPKNPQRFPGVNEYGVCPNCRERVPLRERLSVLRCSRCNGAFAVAAVARGRRSFSAPTLGAARRRAARLERPLLAGELAGVKPDGFELHTSPAAIDARSDVERPLVLVSSSGTPLIHAAGLSATVYLGSLRNARYLGLWLAGRQTRVAILAAAHGGEFREEDRVCCALVAGELLNAGYTPEDEATADLVRRWNDASPDAWLVSNSVHDLRASGRLDDLNFILAHQEDLAEVFRVHHGEVVAVPASVALPA